MKHYIQSFVREFPKNETGAILAFATLIATAVFGGLAIIAAYMGGEVNFFPAFTLPTLFATLTVIHYIARPAAMNYYAKK